MLRFLLGFQAEFVTILGSKNRNKYDFGGGLTWHPWCRFSLNQDSYGRCRRQMACVRRRDTGHIGNTADQGYSIGEVE